MSQEEASIEDINAKELHAPQIPHSNIDQMEKPYIAAGNECKKPCKIDTDDDVAPQNPDTIDSTMELRLYGSKLFEKPTYQSRTGLREWRQYTPQFGRRRWT